ncbi:MAG: L,D-transpeptidase [Gammaproteobacteria bacterium]|nr:L,D-transpeptidase [Gammaproteobacteria bacterium]
MGTSRDTWVRVDIARQRLTLLAGDDAIAHWPVSTARNGVGELADSGCTPRGEHRVRLLIGAGCAVNSVFVGRRPSGEIYSPELGRAYPDRDWILTRIVWLTGTQSGFNRGGSCDTLRRFIYIHGCPDSEPMGVPRSHGCIRMRNDDVIALFARLRVGSRVSIDGTD